MKKILITGGAGFIGSNFIRYILANNPDIQVINFDVLTYSGNLENLNEIEGDKRYKFIKGDICDAKMVRSALDRADVVINFACENHIDRSFLGPATFVKTNILGTQVLLDAARLVGVKRFVQISTDEVFGELGDSEKKEFNEESPYNPLGLLAASKAAADYLVKNYFRLHDIPVNIIYGANNFGPYQFPDKLMPGFITKSIIGEPLVVRTKKAWLDYGHVEDFCRAIEIVVGRGKPGESYCVPGIVESNELNLAEEVLNILGKSKRLIESESSRGEKGCRRAIDGGKIRRELGWRPKHNFSTWLEKTIAWYVDNERWWRRVNSGIYKRAGR